MRHRVLVYLTLVSTLALPVAAVMWGRSYFANDVVYDVGGGRGLVLYSMGGELSVWAGPTPAEAPRRRGFDAVEAGGVRGGTVRQRFYRRPPARQVWLLGFGYAETNRFPHRLGIGAGPVRCVVLPYWFFAAVTVVLPARVLARHMRDEDKRRRDAAGRCPNCEYDFPPGVRCCPECGISVDAGGDRVKPQPAQPLHA